MGKGKKKAGGNPGVDVELVEQYLKLMELQHSVVSALTCVADPVPLLKKPDPTLAF